MRKKTIFPEPMVKSSYCLFCPTNRAKPENIKFAIKEDKEKQQILIFEEAGPVNFGDLQPS